MAVSSSEATSGLLGLSNSLAEAVERTGASVVGVNARQHVPASGVVWREGVVVTADHTIEREDSISIILPDGKALPAAIAGRDVGTDLAVLRVEKAGLRVAEKSNGEGLKVGHIVLAVARPGQTGLSASMGAISAVSGTWRTWSGGQIDQLVRPDLTLYPGFSGGPLVDARGHVAGINTSGLSRAMTLTIPVSTVNRVVDQLLSKGRIARGYLGLGMQQVRLPENLKNSLDLSSDRGLIVVSVEPAGPGEKAGVIVGDVIVKLDSKPVSNTEEVQTLLEPEYVGKTISVGLVRGGSPTEVELTVGERPSRGG